MTLTVGDRAPEFTLQGTLEQEVTLADHRGKKGVVLVFYTTDSTPG